jgi:hypothetical protein
MEITSLYTAEAHGDGSEVQVISPVDGELTDFYITVVGPDSKKYREAVRKFQMKLLEEIEGADIEMLVAITKGWRGLTDGKKDVQYSDKAASTLYADAPFVASQIDRFIADRKNFMPG